MGEKDPVFVWCDVVRETALAVHRFLGPGHLEKVYENALLHRLNKFSQLVVQAQVPLQVLDEDGTILGNYCADLLIHNQLIVELKAVKAMSDEHVAQLLGYLRAARIEHGLLINFGGPKLQINKFILSPSPTNRFNHESD